MRLQAHGNSSLLPGNAAVGASLAVVSYVESIRRKSRTAAGGTAVDMYMGSLRRNSRSAAVGLGLSSASGILRATQRGHLGTMSAASMVGDGSHARGDRGLEHLVSTISSSSIVLLMSI